MENVNNPLSPKALELIDAGAPVSTAIVVTLAGSRDREAIRKATPAFAERHTRNAKAAAAGIYGTRIALERLFDDLAEDLGGTPDQWRELLRYGDRLGSRALQSAAV